VPSVAGFTDGFGCATITGMNSSTVMSVTMSVADPLMTGPSPAPVVMLGRFIDVPSTLIVANVPPAGPGRLNGCAPPQVGSATPSAPKMRPAIIRSRMRVLVPARRFCEESPSCDAASLICTAFLNVVSAPLMTSSITVVDTNSSLIVKPSSRE
jgi:hypothetical protein